MARMNTTVEAPKGAVTTHEGTPAARLTPIKELRRSVLTALLWENQFYEKGSAHAARVAALIPQCTATDVAALAIEARESMHLRHMPLFLVRELARVKGNGTLVADTLPRIIQRPDELTEYLAIYWGGTLNAKPMAEKLSKGSQRGLGRAFRKFDEYALGKYAAAHKGIKLRDVLRLAHTKPESPEQSALLRKVAKSELATPDTWETELSAGKDKKATFERLLREDKLGGLAFLRNLRNMIEAKVDESLINARFAGDFKRVLPFRFIAAATHAPRFEPQLEQAMYRALVDAPKLAGKTALIVDTSPSMWMAKISAKSELDRFDAAAALAILLREVCEVTQVWTFNEKAYEVPPRRGFALRAAMEKTKGSASCGGLAVKAANEEGYDRIIVLTDGQWHYPSAGAKQGRLTWNSYVEGKAEEVSPPPLTAKAYMINVAAYQTGIGYGKWTSIDGWSEAIVEYIRAVEADTLA